MSARKEPKEFGTKEVECIKCGEKFTTKILSGFGEYHIVCTGCVKKGGVGL